MLIVKMEFYSKDWPVISKAINHDYFESRFLYINRPNLKLEKTHLLIRYIGDYRNFEEMIEQFKKQGVVVSIKK